MRFLPWLASFVLTLVFSLAWASTAESRLFWQTFGSTVSTADGSSTWNSNQDYFSPRLPSSGRYGLTSSCYASHSNSAANMYGHALYPGYSSIYGPWHYRQRNHAYGVHCGCSPLRTRGGCGGSRIESSYCGVGVEPVVSPYEAPLYNVEPAGVSILGSIPVEGSGLLTQADLFPLGAPGGGQLPQLPQSPQSQGVLQQLQNLPMLNLPPFSK